MKILLIENDREDRDYIINILSDYDVDAVDTIPSIIDKKYTLVICDFFLGDKTAIDLVTDKNEINPTDIPVLVISGKIDAIPLNRIPTNMNVIVLSKQENFRKMLSYYIKLLVPEKAVAEKEKIDFRTLFLDLIHDLRNDLLSCSYYKLGMKEGFESEEDKEFISNLVIESAVFTYGRLEEYSNYINHDQNIFASVMEAWETIKDSIRIKDNIQNIKFIGDVEKRIEFVPKLFLSIILKNLIENSCKNAPTDRSLAVNVKVEKTDEKTSITVSDNGVGMSEQKAEVLFNAKQQSSDGLGIGLIVLKRIIDGFNGQVSVQSIDGRGTTINITF